MRRAGSVLVGLFGHIVKWARIWCAESQAPQRQPHSIFGPGGRPLRMNPPRIDSCTRLAHRLHRPENTDRRTDSGRTHRTVPRSRHICLWTHNASYFMLAPARRIDFGLAGFKRRSSSRHRPSQDVIALDDASQHESVAEADRTLAGGRAAGVHPRAPAAFPRSLGILRVGHNNLRLGLDLAQKGESSDFPARYDAPGSIAGPSRG